MSRRRSPDCAKPPIHDNCLVKVGRIEGRQVARLREMGRWLAKYVESIYDTRGGPFPTGQWGAATWRDRTIYVHVLDGGKTPVTLPPIDRKILSHQVLTGGEATVDQSDKSISITFADDARNDVDAIVALQLDDPAVGK
jgi:alpha-L-fucosidase